MFTVSIINNNDFVTIGDVSTKSNNRVTGKITQAVNAVDTFTFDIYPNNIGFDSIIPMLTKVVVHDTAHDNANVFTGRVLYISPSMDSTGTCCKTVTCEGELGYLSDTIQMHQTMTKTTIYLFLQTVIGNHNNQVDTDKMFTLGAVNAPETQHTFTCDYNTTLETIQNNLIGNEDIGGEIRLRYADGHKYIDYTSTTFTAGSNTKIELAVNMISASQQIDPSSMITRLIPLGAKSEDSDSRLDIREINKGKPYIDNEDLIDSYGIIVGTQIWDKCNRKELLMCYGQDFFKNQKAMHKQYSVSAADLSLVDKSYMEFKVGTTYRIVNPLIDLDDTIRCIGKSIDISDPTQTTLTFGDKFETLTELTAKKNKAVDMSIAQLTSDLKKQPKFIQDIVSQQTALITGVTDSYYYLDTTPGNERMCFMDSPDVRTAKNVLQLNKNGIGFSHNGINGDYETAWTVDGRFNANYITGQVLKGLQISNGDGTFSVDKRGNVIAKALQILGGKIDITTNAQDNSVIRLSYREWTMEISPLQMLITNSTINGQVKIQAGAVFFKSGDVTKASISSNTGNILSEGEVTANDMQLKLSDSGGYISLREYINNHL